MGFLSPRDEAKRISTGDDKPHHIGPKSFQVKQQELISHVQNYQETFGYAELKAWNKKLQELVRAINER